MADPEKLIDFHDIFQGLHSTSGGSRDCNLGDLADAIRTTHQAVSIPSIEIADMMSWSGEKTSGIPGMVFPHLERTRAKLRMVLLDSSPNSLSAAGILGWHKELIFATLEGALDSVRELFDSTDPTRQLAEIDCWIAWVKMEARFAIDDVKELLHSIAYSTKLPPPGYPYRRILSPKGIRLLVIHPDLDPESIIRCALMDRTDYDKRAYAALSYVWGDLAAPRVDIMVNGIRFPVTSNLRTALKHFRHRTRRRVLWVDAICINQDDAAEKEEQVSKMAQIYSSATYILMWTGEANNDGVFAMQWLREVQMEKAPYTRSSNTIRKYRPEILAFFERPYWRRVWVLQEAICKDNSLVCCGLYAIAWSALCNLVLHWLPTLQKTLGFPGGPENDDYLRLQREGGEIYVDLLESLRWIRLHADFTEKRKRNTPIPLLSGLMASRACYASVAHDYVYGVAGFVSNFPVRINYYMRAYSLYLHLSRDVIKQTAKLDILTACKDWTPDSPGRQLATLKGCSGDPIGNLMKLALRPRPDLETMNVNEVHALFLLVSDSHSPLERLGDNFKQVIRNLTQIGLICLPSWVPRWDVMVKEPYLLLDQEYPQRFNASRGIPAQFSFGNLDIELTLRGIQVDVVRGVKRLQIAPFGALRPAWDFWEQVNPRKSQYPTLEDRRNAFFNTYMRLGATYVPAYVGDPVLYMQHQMFAVEMGWVELAESTQAATDRNIEPEVIKNSTMEYIKRMNHVMTTQAFSVCENGHIGLGPLATRSGDLVCVLNGGDVPFILRPTSGGKYYLVGEACK
jgi:hypothetical protein